MRRLLLCLDRANHVLTLLRWRRHRSAINARLRTPGGSDPGGVRWQAWAYGALILAGYRAWGLGRGPIRPPDRWWNRSGRRLSLGTLWRGYRAELWGAEEFRSIFTPTTDGWAENKELLAVMAMRLAAPCEDS